MGCILKNSGYCQNPDCNEAIEKRCNSYVHEITSEESEELAIERKAILKDIPPELHDILSSMAFYSSSSREFKEIPLNLRVIVYNLKEPLKAMEQRIIAEQSNK